MKMLIIAATQQEIAPFVKLNYHCEVLISGIGIPSTVYHLTKKLLQEKYDVVIQAGIAGSFSKKIRKGDVVVVEQEAFADIGVEEGKKFKTIFEMGLCDKNKFPFKKGWLINTSKVLQISHLKKVKAVTVNKLNDTKKKAKQLKNIFNAEIESMEGAAFHFVCMQQSIQFLQIRSVSNKVGERDKKKWQIKEAIINLNRELKNLFDSINKQ